jgi:hypothetical protein
VIRRTLFMAALFGRRRGSMMIVVHARHITDDAKDRGPHQCQEQNGCGAPHSHQSTTHRSRSAFPITETEPQSRSLSRYWSSLCTSPARRRRITSASLSPGLLDDGPGPKGLEEVCTPVCRCLRQSSVPVVQKQAQFIAQSEEFLDALS